MKILIKNINSKKYKIAESIITKIEAELQNILLESPSLIPVDEIREGISPFIVAVSEFGLPGSGSTDILAFNSEGDIAIIECKLAANTESKRKVIGQILEYASFLWQMSYEEVNNKVLNLKGKNLSDLILENIDTEWEEENFRTTIKQTLEAGSFILVIVVDETNDELRQIIKYINYASKSAFSLHALELKRFKSEDIDILVPHLYGTSYKELKVSSKKQWTEEEFFKVISEKNEPGVVEIIRDIYEWSKKEADTVIFGSGKEYGSFAFNIVKNDKRALVFSIYTPSAIQLNFGWIRGHFGEKVIKEFHSQLIKIPSFRKVTDDFSKLPNIKIKEAFLDHPEYLNRFKEIIIWLRDRVHLID